MKKLIIILIISTKIFSQIVIVPNSMGTAGTIATQACGDEVIGWNPANLGFLDNPEFSISFGIIPIVPLPAVDILNDAVSINWLADYLFSNRHLDNDAKDEMLSVFKNTTWNINPLMYAKILGISSGKFAFSIGAEINSNFQVPKTILETIMYGNKFSEKISFDEIDGSAQAVIPFTFAFGFPIDFQEFSLEQKNNYLGIGVKFLWGIGTADVQSFDGGFTSYHDRIEGNGIGKIKYSQDGFGLGLDLGWAFNNNQGFIANLAVQNLIGFIKWPSDNSEMLQVNFDANIEVGENFEDIIDAFTGTDSTYSTTGFDTDYPRNIIAGIQYNLESNTELYLNYRQYFTDEFQYTKTPRISIGSQFNSDKWFPIRIGVAFGGVEKFQTGFGFGFHGRHYHFDVGIVQTGGFFNSAKGIGISLGQKILF